MKKNFIYLLAFSAFSYVVLTSNSAGYSGNRTGSDGVTSTVGCGGSGCHSSAAGGVNTLLVVDSITSIVPTTSYVPNKLYTFNVSIAKTGATGTPKYGFQLSAVKGTTPTSAGTFTRVPANSAVSVFSGINVVSHTAPTLARTIVGVVGDTFSCTWQAPPAGSGTVTVKGVVNLTNGDGSANSADSWNTFTATLTERSTAGVESAAKTAAFGLYPNPVSDLLHITATEAGVYNITIYNQNGSAVFTEARNLSSGNSTINMAHLPAGVYYVTVANEQAHDNYSFIKQ